MHGTHNSLSDTVREQGPKGRNRVKGGVSGPAEDLRPVAEVAAVHGSRLHVHFPGGNQAQVPQVREDAIIFPPPGSS